MILIHIRKSDCLSNEFPETTINLDRVDSFHFNVEYKYLRMSMGERDYYFTANEAKEYGLVDVVFAPKDLKKKDDAKKDDSKKGDGKKGDGKKEK